MENGVPQSADGRSYKPSSSSSSSSAAASSATSGSRRANGRRQQGRDKGEGYQDRMKERMASKSHRKERVARMKQMY